MTNTLTMRSPVLSFDYIKLFSNSFYINNIILSNSKFLEALAVSNIGLYKLLDVQKDNKIIDTILKYFNRSAVRATPYGLFSNIGNCCFGKDTSVVKENRITKDVKVDFEWFYALIGLIENDQDFLNKVKLKFNHQCYVCGNRLINPYLSQYGQKGYSQNSSGEQSCRIRYTPQVENVIVFASKWVSYADLLKYIKEKNHNIPIKVIIEFIGTLVKKEFLITELRVPLNNIDPLEQLINILDKKELDYRKKEFVNKLKEINLLKKQFAKTSMGKGIDQYLLLCKKMESVHKSKNYVNVVSSVSLKQNTLNKNIKNVLERFGSFISEMAISDNESVYLKKYKEEFIRRYGTYTEVPILEVTDETLGIGNPYAKTIQEQLPQFTWKRKGLQELFENKIIECIKNNNKVLKITEEDLFSLRSLHEENNLKMSKSFDLAFKILAKSNDAIDAGDYKLMLAPCIGSDKGGKLLNRFHNLLSVINKNELNNVYDFNQKDADFMTVSSSFFPQRARTNNICTGKINYNYSIDCGLSSGTQNIELSDIVIGYSDYTNRLYLKSKSLNRKIIAISDSMLNRMIDFNILKLMWEISYSNEIQPIESLLCLRTLDFKYLPQIECGGVILNKERWIVSKSDFNDINNYNEFLSSFLGFKKRWGLPRLFYIFSGDKYLYIDSDSSINLRLLFNELKKILKLDNKIIFEAADDVSELWVKDQDDKLYTSEFIVQYVCSKKTRNNEQSAEFFANTNSNITKNKAVPSFINRRRTLQLGDEGWIYLKIFVDRKKCNEFLGDQLNTFIQKLIMQKKIDGFFFLRYSDPEFHIRLRIKVNVNVEKYEVLNQLKKWFVKIMDLGYSMRFIIDQYEREIERYGGEELITFAENLFYFDSLLALQLINIKISDLDQNKQNEIDCICCVAIVQMAIDLSSGIKNANSYLSLYIQHNEFKEAFRMHKKNIMLLYENMQLNTKYKNITQLMDLRIKSIHEYANKIYEIDKQGKLTNYISDIVLSMIHMFCNRMDGDRLWERKVSAMARHTIYTIEARQIYLEK
ncbi:lantibiotic dehydratase [Eubacterium limosum]|uniref:lantibiotic dehydratase n=1 Tax=Eubacterium limosum TaxID=1736 RepID=UPI001559FC1C|nr:lantibiotic dehydratase [Eubacterium limosum]